MIRRPPRSTQSRSSAASDVYKRQGGMVEAIDAGFVQREIQSSAYRYQKSIEDSSRIIVGVNKFQLQEEAPRDLLKVDPALRQIQIDKIQQVKSTRDLSLIHISEPTRLGMISYAVFC